MSNKTDLEDIPEYTLSISIHRKQRKVYEGPTPTIYKYYATYEIKAYLPEWWAIIIRKPIEYIKSKDILRGEEGFDTGFSYLEYKSFTTTDEAELIQECEELWRECVGSVPLIIKTYKD